MAKQVNQGRRGAKIEGDFVVFLIGARPDKLHPIRSFRDLGAMRGMPYMLKYLSEQPEKGLLGFESYGIFMNVQYWRSFEHLERFAKDDSDPHLKVWRTYWKRVGKDPRSGIWHETFLVRAGEYEAVYGNMPPHGLGKATEVVSIGADSSARGRIGRLPQGMRAVPEAVTAWAARLAEVEWVSDLWVAGSVATGDYVPGVSDLDLVALVDGPVDSEREAGLVELHRGLDVGAAAGTDLGAVYVDAGRLADSAATHPTWTHGRLVQASSPASPGPSSGATASRRRRGEHVVSPRLRTGFIAWWDARATVGGVRQSC